MRSAVIESVEERRGERITLPVAVLFEPGLSGVWIFKRQIWRKKVPEGPPPEGCSSLLHRIPVRGTKKRP